MDASGEGQDCYVFVTKPGFVNGSADEVGAFADV
jgi:hypothetical protein